MKNEIWMDIPHYEGLYQVSNFGRVKALERKRVNHTGGEWIQPECIMSISYTTDGYEKVSLTDANHNRKTERIHRLVALAFVPNPLNLPEVNHLNCVRDDNRPENLEWVTHAENNAYTSKYGHKSNKKIKCIETGEVFYNLSECCRQAFFNRKYLIQIIKEKRPNNRRFLAKWTEQELEKAKKYQGCTFEYVEDDSNDKEHK